MVILYSCIILFYGFVFYAGVKQAWGRLSFFGKVLLAPPVLVFGAADLIFNATIGSLLFLEIPHEWTFSERCDLDQGRSGYRGKLAKAICRLLNSIIPGHCKG